MVNNWTIDVDYKSYTQQATSEVEALNKLSDSGALSSHECLCGIGGSCGDKHIVAGSNNTVYCCSYFKSNINQI